MSVPEIKTEPRSIYIPDLKCPDSSVLEAGTVSKFTRNRPLQMVAFDGSHMSSYYHSIVTMLLSLSFPIYSQILIKTAILLQPCASGTPVGHDVTGTSSTAQENSSLELTAS